MMEDKPLYIAQPRQDSFHRSPAKFRLYGGAAGSGKSHAMLFEAIALAQEVPKSHILLLRRTFPELKMSLIRLALETIPKELYKYSKNDHTFRWLPADSVIQFGYCDKEDDVYRYQGAEFDFIGMDEMTQFSEFQFRYLISRLRTSKEGVQARFFGATNPGGQGHEFVKRLFIEKKYNSDDVLAGFKSEDFEFIPGFLHDNKYLGDDYLKNLQSLPEHQRKMLLEGSWDVYEGKFFEEFDPGLHVIDPIILPDYWRRYRAIDFGRSAPFACLWFAIDPEGNVYCYREYYEKGKDVDPNTEMVIKISGDEKYGYTVVDTSVFASTGFGETIGQRMQRKGLDLIPAHKARVSGWATVKQYLHHTPTQKPKLFIFKGCENLIHEMTHVLYDKNNVEDLNTKMADHALDALRYFLMTLRDRASSQATVEETKEYKPNPMLVRMLNNRKEMSRRFNPNDIY